MVSMAIVPLCLVFVATHAYLLDKKGKPGTCPQIPPGHTEKCGRACISDYDCEKGRKCCTISKCGKNCALPDFSIIGSPVNEHRSQTLVGRGGNIDNSGRLSTRFSASWEEGGQATSVQKGSGSGIKCRDECSNTPCDIGYICVKTNCHSLCQIDSSFANTAGSFIGQSDSQFASTRRVGDSGPTSGGCINECQGGCMIGQMCVEIGCDRICQADTEKSGKATAAGKKGTGSKCRQLCSPSAVCEGSKQCVKVGCHMLCRRRGYL